MKRIVACALVLGCLALSASPAWAQGRGFFGGLGGSPAMLLGQKSVQDELKVSDEQKEKIKDLQEKQRTAFGELRDLSQEERQKKLQELNEANKTAIAEILKPDQQKRLKQIAWQQQGGLALADPEVEKALKLSADQKDKVKTLREDLAKEGRELAQGGNNDETRQKIQELRKNTSEKMLATLSDDQKKQWKEMTGAPFTGEIVPFRRRNQN